MLATRADLKIFPAFADLEADTAGNPCVWENIHSCESCRISWSSFWSCGCNDHCPKCDAETEPQDTIWTGPQTPVLIALWHQLPEAV